MKNLLTPIVYYRASDNKYVVNFCKRISVEKNPVDTNWMANDNLPVNECFALIPDCIERQIIVEDLEEAEREIYYYYQIYSEVSNWNFTPTKEDMNIPLPKNGDFNIEKYTSDKAK